MKVKHINLEQECQLDCIYCRRNTYVSNGYKTKSFDEIISEFESICLENPDLEMVSIRGGGEPTLLPGFLTFCEILKKRGLRFNIETDGILLSDEIFLKRLIALGLDYVIINFNSYYPAIYDEITNSKGYYPKVCLALKNLEKNSVYTAFNIVILKQNIDHFYKIPFFISSRFPRLLLKSFNISLVRINSPAKDFKEGSFRFSDHSAAISNNINNLKNHFLVELGTGAGSFPFCIFPEITVLRKDFVPSEIENDRMHIKTRECGICRFNGKCPGIPSTYIEIYGLGEIRPL